MNPSTRNTATGSLKPASPSSVSARRRRSEEPCSSAKTAAPSVEARIEPSSRPSSVERSNSSGGEARDHRGHGGADDGEPERRPSTGRNSCQPVARPPSNRITASARRR